jgi:LysM repeat protein
MSAALALDLDQVAYRDAAAAPLSRPQLHLVPTGTGVDVHPVRLTRLGRLIRTGVVLVILVVLSVTTANAVAAGRVTAHTVTVERGQTLSQIAARELPSLPTREGVARLQLANGLNSGDVHAGQVLQVPATG